MSALGCICDGEMPKTRSSCGGDGERSVERLCPGAVLESANRPEGGDLVRSKGCADASSDSSHRGHLTRRGIRIWAGNIRLVRGEVRTRRVPDIGVARLGKGGDDHRDHDAEADRGERRSRAGPVAG